MKCRNCNTKINYNYIASCPQCGHEVDAADLPKLDPSTTSLKKNRLSLYSLAKVVYVLVVAAVGMVSAAVVSYFSAAVIYIALSTPESFPGQHCARGMLLGMLSILFGGFLGTAGGAVFAIKHPISKTLVTANHPD